MKPIVLGLITARGGSKSIPRKNIVQLAGKPLIAWTIVAALEASSLSRVIVSTDDAEIAQVSREWGAEAPFMRPVEFAQDDSPHIDVILHAVEWLMSHESYCPDYVMLLQPTSPLRTAQDIETAIRLAVEKKAESVISVCETHQHPYLITRITEDGALVDFMSGAPEPGTSSIRRQDMPPAYFVNGAIYLTQCKVLLDKRTLLPTRTFPYIMPPERSMQIDDPWDLYLVDMILRDKLYNSERGEE